MQIITELYRSACVVRDKTGRPSKRYHNVHLRTLIFIQNINIRFVFLLFVIIVSAHVRLIFPKLFGGICIAGTALTTNWEPSKAESPAVLRAHRTEWGREMGEKKNQRNRIRNTHNVHHQHHSNAQTQNVFLFLCSLARFCATFIEWQRFRSIARFNWLDIIWLSFLCWLSCFSIFFSLSSSASRFFSFIAPNAGLYDLIEIRPFGHECRSNNTCA